MTKNDMFFILGMIFILFFQIFDVQGWVCISYIILLSAKIIGK